MTATTAAAATESQGYCQGQCATCFPKHELSFHDVNSLHLYNLGCLQALATSWGSDVFVREVIRIPGAVNHHSQLGINDLYTGVSGRLND
jgi:hypothetical protein